MSAGFVFYLRALQIRRIRRRKLEAEKRRRARIKWHNDEWNIDEFIEFSETVHKKELFLFLPHAIIKAERMGNVWTHL